MARLMERAKSAEERAQTLEGLADYRDQLLKDSEWRYHELLQQLNLSQESNLALIRSLPAAIAETAAPDPAPKPTAGLVAVRKAVSTTFGIPVPLHA